MEEKDARIKFLHPSLPSTFLIGPKEMIYGGCHCKINVPLATSLGQTYMITDEDLNNIKSFSLQTILIALFNHHKTVSFVNVISL